MTPPPPQRAAASRLLRAGPPASAASVLNASGVTALARSLSRPRDLRSRSPYRRSPSHVPCKSRRPGSRRLHAGHRLASRRAPARLIPGQKVTPGSDAALSNNDASTANPVTGAFNATSSWSPPDASCAPFPDRSPRQCSTNAASGGLAPTPKGRRWRANKPPSLAQLRL